MASLSSSSSSLAMINSLSVPISLLAILYSLPTTSAFTWSFQNTPQQCKNLTISISGNDGVPPYSIIIVPNGPTALSNGVEARKNVEVKFDGSSMSTSFQLKYPQNSQFVAVVSDSANFGSGGTSAAAAVTSSDDDSCFNHDTSVSPDFNLFIDPPNQAVTCQNMRLWWDPAKVQGTPKFLGIIPGGQSFSIPQGNITDQSAQGLGVGFSWKPNVRPGTQLIIVAGDNRSSVNGGSSSNTVQAGPFPDNSCLTGTIPSSTPGSPAGGSYPTSTNGSGVGGGGGGGANVGAIVGGIIGGIALFIILFLVFWFYRREKKKQQRIKERPVDLLNADDDGDESPENANGRPRTNELPQYYQPEPFIVPDPTIDGSVIDADEEGRRPMSGTSTSFYTRTGTPDPTSTSISGFGPGVGGSSVGGERRKGGALRPMRAVNIIQHDDAGPSLPAEEAETIELPPAYTAVGRNNPGTSKTTPPVEG